MWSSSGGLNEGRLPDPAITQKGHLQAQLLAEFLAESNPDHGANYYARRHNRSGFGLTHLYTSLMVRAIATASYISTRSGLPLVGWPDIHERGGLHNTDPETGEEIGVGGPDRAALIEQFPDLMLPNEVGTSGWWNRPKESVDETFPRALRTWDTLLSRHGRTDDRVAIVTHAGFFQSLLVTLLGVGDVGAWKTPLVDQVWIGLSNTGITRISFRYETASIYYVNRVDHLPSDLITG